MDLERTIACALCGLVCQGQVTHTHLRKAHGISCAEYKALGFETLSPARLMECRNSPIGRGDFKGQPSGPSHPQWKGGSVSHGGYRVFGHKYEHRIVAEQMLGRPLQENEVVHHKDGNKLNNSPENLQVMTASQHAKVTGDTRWSEHINPECKEAAKALFELGWSKRRIMLALRIHHTTLKSWIT